MNKKVVISCDKCKNTVEFDADEFTQRRWNDSIKDWEYTGFLEFPQFVCPTCWGYAETEIKDK